LLSAWNAFAGGLKWAYDTLIKPVVDALSWAYNNILKPIGDFFGGVGKALGGVGNAISGFFSGSWLPKFAEGGVVTKPTVALIGEAGAEAVIPLNKMQSNPSATSQTLVLAPTFNFPEGSINTQSQDPREFAEEVYDHLSRIIRSDLKAQTFFVPR